MLPSLAAPLWDTSGVLSQKSAFGTLLHGMIGYDEQPAGMQLVFYVTVLLVITLGGRWVAARAKAAPKLASGKAGGVAPSQPQAKAG